MAVPLDPKPSRPLGRHLITLGNFGSAAVEVEAARLQLASALLSIANEESRNAAVLKRAALERMALDYKDRPSGSRR
jgi:ribosomal protein S7